MALRIAALALFAAWTLCVGPELLREVHDRTAGLALLAALVSLSVCVAIPRVGRAARAAVMAASDRTFVGACVVANAALTAWVHRVPMHGQVVSGDACMYVAQARALAHGSFSLPVGTPRLAYAAKFLIEGVDGGLHGVFVPGYPLFIAPFVRWNLFLLAALVTSTLLVLAHAALARAALRDSFAARLSLLLLLPSFARALETADLLSHAFTGAMAAFALAAALHLRQRSNIALCAAMGLCAGWVFGARMLDGFVIGAVIALALARPLLRRAFSPRMLAIALVCALPFVALVALQQKAATGQWRRPTAVEYADRSDWPRRCLHLGFGREVGCQVEHPGERASFGPDGYSPEDALRLIRERSGLHGAELFGAAAVTIVGFAGLVFAPTFEALLVALFPVLLTLAYGLFYYGNGIIHGARHVFPAAPFTAIVIAHALTSLARARDGRSPRWSGESLDGAALLAALAFAMVAHPPRWRERVMVTDGYQRERIDLPALLAGQHIERGIVIFPDVHSYLAGVDPWSYGPELIVVHDDRSGEADLRRAHPELPVWLVMRDRRVLRVGSAAPGPGLLLEFERAWPSFQRPTGLGAGIIHTLECCGVPSSGNRGLLLFEAHPGDTLEIPFDLAASENYAFRLAAITAPDAGRYELSIDGAPLMAWEGYAPGRALVERRAPTPRRLSAGAHTLLVRCVGKAPASTGYVTVLDALMAEPAP